MIDGTSGRNNPNITTVTKLYSIHFTLKGQCVTGGGHSTSGRRLSRWSYTVCASVGVIGFGGEIDWPRPTSSINGDACAAWN